MIETLPDETDEDVIVPLKLKHTQFEFCNDDSRIVWLEGPAGEGKTFAGIAAAFRHRQRMLDYYAQRRPGKAVRPMQLAIIRDTHVNIKANTVKSIQRAFPGTFAFRDDFKKMFQTGVDIQHVSEWYEKPEGNPPTWIDTTLFGMDNLDSLDRIQGGEYDMIWIEEPAPIRSTGNNGIREEVYLVCGARIRGIREDPNDPTDLGCPKRLQVTMNPADEEHWTSRQQDVPIIPSMTVYRIKRGENTHLSEFDREMTKMMYKGRADLEARFVEGKRARVYDGVAVTPEFNDHHIAFKEWLMPDPALEVIRMWDGGLNPSCVIGQITLSGRFLIFDSIVGQNMGMHQMITSKLKYVLGRPRYKRVKKWRDCGDPALVTREGSNSDHTAAKVIEDELKTSYEPGISSWEIRREALKFIMTNAPGGIPMLQVNNRTTETEKINWIKAGFQGDYCYKVTPDGRVIRDIPVKNMFSHPCDAVSHVVAHIFFQPKKEDPIKLPSSIKNRAKGYGVN